jgi:Tol biopolymer transport system component
MVQEAIISVASADFSDPVEIATGDAPVWSPDGTLVAVAYDFDEQARPIYAVVDLEGNTVQSGIAGYTPSWSPDGTRIATEYYNPEGEPLIHVVDVATGEVVFETEGQQPAWRP